jgi:hypothetical protein
MARTQFLRCRPPHPDPAPENLSPRQLASLMRTNNLRVWSQRAYEEEVIVRRFYGRASVLFNTPEAIRHVLVDDDLKVAAGGLLVPVPELSC